MRGLLALLFTGLVTPTFAADCQTETFDGAPISWCAVDPKQERLRLFLFDGEGRPFGTFNRVNEGLADKNARLGIAMNAGMYHQDRAPVGLYIENGVEIAPIVTREGPGNFGLLPNGVFCLSDTGATVVESVRFASDPPDCVFATQSGPMLVIDGALHPRFIRDSDSLNVRNGIGVRDDGAVIIAISDAPVNFHHFARFFRDSARTANALFLDGTISKLYAPELGRDDVGLPMGPILGTVEPSG
ncbi:MAG: phosphodiester glycosidase family protein [Pseudomonadota bacterium]